MKLPEFTYHVIAAWPDGDTVACEAFLDRDSAFDKAADMITNWACDTRVERVERNAENGLPLCVSDVTGHFLAERFQWKESA